MLDEQSIILDIKKVIIEKLEFNIKPEDIEDDELLFGGGLGINSMSSVILINEIEKKFNIEISDDELTIDLFDNIKKLALYVLKKTKK